MGLLDMIKNAAGAPGNNEPSDAGASAVNSGVMGGLLQALEEHPGGLPGVLSTFRSNGLGDHVQSWANGDNGTGAVVGQPASSPGQIEQGLAGTGLIEKVAAKAGVSPEVAKVAMATILPLVVAHFTNGGQQAAPQSGYGGIASQILSRLR